MHCSSLRRLGAHVAPPIDRIFRGVGVAVGPAVALMPSFAPCFTVLGQKLPAPSTVTISQRSSLVVTGEDIRVQNLELDGALVIDVADGASLRIDGLAVRNRGWEFVELSDAEQAAAEEVVAIRGFRLVRHETYRLRVVAGEHVVVRDGVVSRSTKADPRTWAELAGRAAIALALALIVAATVRRVR